MVFIPIFIHALSQQFSYLPNEHSAVFQLSLSLSLALSSVHCADSDCSEWIALCVSSLRLMCMNIMFRDLVHFPVIPFVYLCLGSVERDLYTLMDSALKEDDDHAEEEEEEEVAAE